LFPLNCITFTLQALRWPNSFLPKSAGMDPINERKMFQQLVRAASQINTPQFVTVHTTTRTACWSADLLTSGNNLSLLHRRCFLLTPKLLPDLEYSGACSILNIMNGPWIEEPAKGTCCLCSVNNELKHESVPHLNLS